MMKMLRRLGRRFLSRWTQSRADTRRDLPGIDAQPIDQSDLSSHRLSLYGPFPLDDYIRTVERQNNVTISFEDLEDANDPVYQMGLINEGKLAQLNYRPSDNAATIVISDTVKQDQFLYVKYACHELYHAAKQRPGRWPAAYRHLKPPARHNLARGGLRAILQAEADTDRGSHLLMLSSVLGDKTISTHAAFKVY